MCLLSLERISDRNVDPIRSYTRVSTRVYRAYSVCEGRTVSFSVNSTGVFKDQWLQLYKGPHGPTDDHTSTLGRRVDPKWRYREAIIS